jgi:hypothetical protein
MVANSLSWAGRTFISVFTDAVEAQTHLQCDREAELRRQRAERLQIDIDQLAARHAALLAERAMLVAKLP